MYLYLYSKWQLQSMQNFEDKQKSVFKYILVKHVHIFVAHIKQEIEIFTVTANVCYRMFQGYNEGFPLLP